MLPLKVLPIFDVVGLQEDQNIGKKIANFWKKWPKQLSIKKSTPKLNLKVKNIGLKPLLKP
jgi:hypothetical protein